MILLVVGMVLAAGFNFRFPQLLNGRELRVWRDLPGTAGPAASPGGWCHVVLWGFGIDKPLTMQFKQEPSLCSSSP